MLNRTFQSWLLPYLSMWISGLGALFGLGLGACALFTIKGVIGVAVCLFALDFAL